MVINSNKVKTSTSSLNKHTPTGLRLETPSPNMNKDDEPLEKDSLSPDFNKEIASDEKVELKDVVTVPEIDQDLIDSHHRASGYFEQEYVDIENLL